MNVVVTGASGFIGKNLCLRLKETGDFNVIGITRQSSATDLADATASANIVFHLAGANRPETVEEFHEVNTRFTESVCNAASRADQPIPIVYTSSIQAEADSPYGRSKKAAEDVLLRYHERSGDPTAIFRLPNVFGKWCRPNYNGVVATFCHHIIRDLPITIHNPSSSLSLVYIDDVVNTFISLLKSGSIKSGFQSVKPVYHTTVGELAETIRSFKSSRDTLTTDHVGKGLVRALYSTYLSYLPAEQFAYKVPKHGDHRGVFVEMLKTPDSGQFSFFTAHPGITRGDHYHHTKTEKFLVIKGKACFGFRNVITEEKHELYTHGDDPQVVETVPGWTHNITNVGDEEMVVMLWANEIFDREVPDTIAQEV